jgi:hypothetical protein
VLPIFPAFLHCPGKEENLPIAGEMITVSEKGSIRIFKTRKKINEK